MGMFEQFPYSNFHELNLDWIINKLNELGQNAVLSVNGQTGDVVLYEHPYVEFPEITANSWKISRTASGKDVGIYFANDHLYFVDGAVISKVYTETDTPPYPVTSVNGQTGNIELYQEAGIRFPNVTDGYFNTRRQINTGAAEQAIVGLEVDTTKAKRIKDNLRYDIYDTGNPPPYPVSSVNGQTGAVILAIPFNGPLSDSTWIASTPSATHQAGMARETMDGTVSIYTVSDANHAEAFVKFVSADEQTTYTKKLLTTDDIPSGAGVVSVNGLSGVVLITGSEINTNAIDGRTINQDVQRLYAADALLRDEIGIVCTGNQCAVSVSAGQYVILKDSTITGCSDGLYTAAQAIPANTAIDSTYLTAVSGGGLNALNDAIAMHSSALTGADAGTTNNFIQYDYNFAFITFNSASKTWTEGDVFGTIPSGIRPVAALVATGNLYANNIGVRIRIGTDGTISYDSQNSVTGRIAFTAMYAIQH